MLRKILLFGILLGVAGGCVEKSHQTPPTRGSDGATVELQSKPELDELFLKCYASLEASVINAEGNENLGELVLEDIKKVGDKKSALILKEQSEQVIAAVAYYTLYDLNPRKFPKVTRLLLDSPNVVWNTELIARESGGHAASQSEIKQQALVKWHAQ